MAEIPSPSGWNDFLYALGGAAALVGLGAWKYIQERVSFKKRAGGEEGRVAPFLTAGLLTGPHDAQTIMDITQRSAVAQERMAETLDEVVRHLKDEAAEEHRREQQEQWREEGRKQALMEAEERAKQRGQQRD